MAESYEEKDLFGDDEEEDLFGDDDDPKLASPSSGSAQPEVRSTPTAPAGDIDDEELELFGSDDEAKDTPGLGPDDEEKELFGSDDEEEGATPAVTATPIPTPAKPPSEQKQPSEADLSEMDERDIFGDISDEELPEKVEDVIVRNRPKPDKKSDFVTVRLPNILSFEKTPFKPYTEKTLSDTLQVGFSEMDNTMDREVIKLLNPENCIRWRFQREADESIKHASNGRPLYESNARIVEWEDGSKTLHVGKESFNIAEVPDSALLFEENSRDIHVCHGEIKKRFLTTPTSLTSGTHSMLKIAQFRKYMPKARTKIIELDEAQKALDAQKKMQEIQASPAKKPRIEGDNEKDLTTAWLEDDEPRGEGPSVKDIKRGTLRERIEG
mmetsp:Transcript_81823/g.154522  ORF Transcript_81823/g.154522 Transcript_81823/m.154522 type:complete len:383 (-) Transcript_81823:12-1160(-)